MPVYKDNKRNTWYFRVYVIDPNGHKKQKEKSGFKTKSEAKLEEQKLLLNYSEKIVEDILFSALYNEYINFKKQSIKPQSLITIKNKIENHILPFFKDYKIKDINHSVFIKWRTNILEKNYSYKYNSSLHICVVNILNYAMQFYGLDTNIASKIGNFKKNTVLKKYDFWTFEEYYRFISFVDDIVYKTLFRVLYFTGMRLGECLALNWNDLDLHNGFIDISKTISQKARTNGKYTITTPKSNASNRTIRIDNETKKELLALKDYYNNFVGFNSTWFVFGGIKPLATTTITRKKDYYCSLSGIKRIKIHDFRHSHASVLISSGIPVTVISSRLGHANITMTLNIYSHLIPKDEEKVINLINNIEERSSY